MPKSIDEVYQLLDRPERSEVDAARVVLWIAYSDLRKALLAGANSVLKNADDAEDVLQDVLVKQFVHRFRTYKAGARNLGGWLYVIVRNRARAVWRTRQRLIAISSTAGDSGEEGAMAFSAAENPERRLRARSAFADCLDDISQRNASVLQALLWGETVSDVAKDHGLSEDNVRQIKSRYGRKVMDCFEEQMGGDGF